MLNIPVNDEEKAVIENSFAPSAVAKRLLFSNNGLIHSSNPIATTANEINDPFIDDNYVSGLLALLKRQEKNSRQYSETASKLLNVLEEGEEKKERYGALLNKLNKFGY